MAAVGPCTAGSLDCSFVCVSRATSRRLPSRLLIAVSKLLVNDSTTAGNNSKKMARNRGLSTAFLTSTWATIQTRFACSSAFPSTSELSIALLSTSRKSSNRRGKVSATISGAMLLTAASVGRSTRVVAVAIIMGVITLFESKVIKFKIVAEADLQWQLFRIGMKVLLGKHSFAASPFRWRMRQFRILQT